MKTIKQIGVKKLGNHKLMDLPVGIGFEVVNSHGSGKIIEENGIKYAHIFEVDKKLKITQNLSDELEILTEEELREQKRERDTNTYLINGDADCEHDIEPKSGGGIHCLKCDGWFCY